MDRQSIVIPARPTTIGPFRPDPPTVSAYPAAVVEFEEKLHAGQCEEFFVIWQRHIERIYAAIQIAHQLPPQPVEGPQCTSRT